MLSGEQAIKLEVPPDVLVASLREIAAVLPRLVDQRSISTWESGGPRNWFNVVAIEESARVQVEPTATTVPASYILSSEKFRDSFATALGHETLAVENLSRFVKITRLFEQLENTTQIDEPDFLAGVLNDATANLVLEYPQAQELAAQLIVRGDETARRATHANSALLLEETMATIGQRVAENLPDLTISDELGGWIELMPQPFMTGLLRGLRLRYGVESDLVVPPPWPKAIILAALKTTNIHDPIEQALVAAAVVRKEIDWVFDLSIDERPRAHLLQGILAEGSPKLSTEDLTAASDLLAIVGARSPELVVAALGLLPVTDRVDLLFQFLDDLPKSGRPAPASLLELVAQLVGEVPGSTSAELLLRIDRKFARKSTAAWDYVADLVLSSLIETVILDPRLRYPTTLFHLRETVTSDSVLGHAVDQAFGPLADIVGRQREVTGHWLARRILIDAALSAFPASIGRLTAALESSGATTTPSFSDLQSILVAAARASIAYDHADTTALLLRYAGRTFLDRIDRSPKARPGVELGQLASAAFLALFARDAALARAVRDEFSASGKKENPWVQFLKLPSGRNRLLPSRRLASPADEHT